MAEEIKKPGGELEVFTYKGIEIPQKLKETFTICIGYLDGFEDDITIGFAEEASACKDEDELLNCFVGYINQITIEFELDWSEDVGDYLARLGLLEEDPEE